MLSAFSTRLSVLALSVSLLIGFTSNAAQSQTDNPAFFGNDQQDSGLRSRAHKLLARQDQGLASDQHLQDPANDPMQIYRNAGVLPDQETKIRALATEWEAGAKDKNSKISELVHKLQAMSLQPEPDFTKAFAIQTQVNNLMAQMSMSKLQLLQSIRNVLNPDQKKRLVKILKANGQRPAQQ